ncbi:MAG: 30S ribosomal protein S8 [Candidatus Melainabacteria bacterium RIFCSPLOWO2_02_FULL_35_15]|nr:MAG: 30S ribosomal protein S8 [Candidatus Melainabacteria bacterium RIFCSPLOWO2_12_FULL_35_11]OGI12918.1 MAG: 30S ribosomal protein S8 [Candidatus Melainabacteria bacterium RIFCSPLOWO2_02_FULL_35_15]
MSHTDSISDMLTRIRNAVHATHESVEIPLSKLKIQIAEVLKKEGYISSYELFESDPVKKNIKVFLKYGPRGEKLITGIQKVSKPGLRVYTKSKDAKRVLDGLGIYIISTSRGLMTDRQARKEKVGGEVLCKVW